MTPSFAEVESQARLLTAEERARLAEIVLETLQETTPAEVASAWDKEIESRVAAYDRGETQTYAAEDVFAEARRLAR